MEYFLVSAKVDIEYEILAESKYVQLHHSGGNYDTMVSIVPILLNILVVNHPFPLKGSIWGGVTQIVHPEQASILCKRVSRHEVMASPKGCFRKMDQRMSGTCLNAGRFRMNNILQYYF